MKTATVITTGSELVEGIILNTNAKFISSRLTEIGIKVLRNISVDDDTDLITKAVKDALVDSTIVVISGGLGPTEDDKTREAVATALNRKITVDETLKRAIRERVSRYHKYLPENIDRQAMVIEGASILPNTVGSAPGQRIDVDERIIVLLPGPPQELQPMFESFLRQLHVESETKTVSLLFFGIAEATLDEIMTKLSPEPCIRIATQASFSEGVCVRLTAATDCEKELQEFVSKLSQQTHGHLIATENTTLEEVLVKVLREKKKTVAIAESCTGGMVSSKIVNVPGASEVFLGGVVAYDNSVKVNLLGVKSETIEIHGAVSEECVIEMANGVRRLLSSDIALAVSGIAGPSGGSSEKPVGTVYFAISDERENKSTKFFYPQERNIFRARIAAHGLYLIWRYLHNMI
ncbi:competence/damage-inducible protein A [Pseudothermotoga sp. U03pept]|uniref:competence/damage-inducible protein A n=1 Tax=Pseudothermotoga sp. U03pept TaxID=3447012 RepID=UPI00309734E2